MRKLPLFGIALLVPVTVFASSSDGTATQGTSPTSSSSSTSQSTWDIKLGFLEDYKASSQQFYYNFSYLGQSLSAHGTAMSAASDYSAGGLADVTGRAGFLQLTRGIPTVGGNLLSGYNTTSIKKLLQNSLGSALEDFNVVVGVDAQLDTVQNSSYSYGVEYKPIPFLSYFVPSNRMPEISSVLKLGFTGVHNVGTDGKSTESAEPTLRAIFGWKHSFSSSVDTATEDQLAKDYDTYIDQYDTKAKFKTHILDKLKAPPLKWDFLSSVEEQRFAQRCLAVWDSTPHPTDKAWSDALKDQIKDKGAASYYEIPQLALWAEANARYVVAGTIPSDPWRSIYSLNLKFYLDRAAVSPKYVQVQFRNGFTEVNPTARTNTFMVYAGIDF